MRRRIEQDARADRAGVAHVDEGDLQVLRRRADDLAGVLDRGRLAEQVLHEQARPQDRPLDAAVLEPLLDRGVAAADHRRRIRRRHRAAAADPHQIFGAALQRRIEHVVLLLDHARIVPGDHEHAVDAGQRLFQRRLVGQFGDRDFGVGAQHLARLVGIAHDADRVLAQRLEFLDHRPPGVSGRPDYSNRHCRFLPNVVGFRASPTSFRARLKIPVCAARAHTLMVCRIGAPSILSVCPIAAKTVRKRR